MNFEFRFGTEQEHADTAKKAKDGGINYILTADISRNPYLQENLWFIQVKNLATVELVENYEAQSSCYVINWL